MLWCQTNLGRVMHLWKIHLKTTGTMGCTLLQQDTIPQHLWLSLHCLTSRKNEESNQHIRIHSNGFGLQLGSYHLAGANSNMAALWDPETMYCFSLSFLSFNRARYVSILLLPFPFCPIEKGSSVEMA